MSKIEKWILIIGIIIAFVWSAGICFYAGYAFGSQGASDLPLVAHALHSI